jgi:hypothetical protein
VDVKTGAALWETRVSEDRISASVLVDEERKTIYIGTGNANGRPISNGVAAPDSPYSNGILAINY